MKIKRDETTLEDMIQEQNDERNIKHKEKKDHTSQDLRTQVLKHGVFMIEKLQNAVHNKDEDMSNQQYKAYEMLWPVLEGMISHTSDIQKMKLSNATDVIKLIAKGKISPKDGMDFLEILKIKTEIDEIPKLLEQIEGLEKWTSTPLRPKQEG